MTRLQWEKAKQQQKLRAYKKPRKITLAYRKLRLRFPAACLVCGQPQSAGTVCWWHRGTDDLRAAVVCTKCGPDAKKAKDYLWMLGQVAELRGALR